MRGLLALVLLGAALWSGYWYVSSRTVQAGYDSWLEARRAEGWVAEATDVSVTGYPNRIDTIFTDLSLADPGTGLAWDTSRFEILALSYKRNHVIAVWPAAQRIATPFDKFDLTSENMRASLVVEADTPLAIQRATMTADKVSIRPFGRVLQEDQDGTDLAALTLAMERLEEVQAPTYRFGVKADGVSPSLPWRIRIDPAGALPEALEALTADITVTFDAPWDRFAIERARPQPRAIRIKRAEARWGQLEILLAGDLEVDETGQPTGQLTVKARNWRDILKLGAKAGLLSEGLAETLEDGLGLLAQLSGNPKTLDVPLDFADGRVFLGPIPLGPAPVLTLR